MTSLYEELKELYKTLDFKIYLELIESLIKINKFKIDSELSLQPGLFGYYSGLLTLARRDKAEFENSVANRSSLIRSEAISNNTGKKYTVQALDDKVAVDTMIKVLNQKLRLVDTKIGWIKNLVDALESRQQCLIQLSANSRAEVKLHS